MPPADSFDDRVTDWLMRARVEHADGWQRGPMGVRGHFRSGVLHLDTGPAIEWVDGSVEYWKDGLLDREDGPAVLRLDGVAEWWCRGELVRVSLSGVPSAGTLDRNQLLARLRDVPRLLLEAVEEGDAARSLALHDHFGELLDAAWDRCDGTEERDVLAQMREAYTAEEDRWAELHERYAATPESLVCSASAEADPFDRFLNLPALEHEAECYASDDPQGAGVRLCVAFERACMAADRGGADEARQARAELDAAFAGFLDASQAAGDDAAIADSTGRAHRVYRTLVAELEELEAADRAV